MNIYESKSCCLPSHCLLKKATPLNFDEVIKLPIPTLETLDKSIIGYGSFCYNLITRLTKNSTLNRQMLEEPFMYLQNALNSLKIFNDSVYRSERLNDTDRFEYTDNKKPGFKLRITIMTHDDDSRDVEKSPFAIDLELYKFDKMLFKVNFNVISKSSIVHYYDGGVELTRLSPMSDDSHESNSFLNWLFCSNNDDSI